MEVEDRLPQPLVWPPLADDLRRLYVDRKLSASKIAKIYGLRYASEKTAESTILYHLKRNGISRRDPAAHIRKVTEAMVDEWVGRYEKGESLKQIAGSAVDPVTVFNHLHKREVQLRDKIGAQIAAVTKHPRRPFEGTEPDKAYLVGLVLGDFHVMRHGRAIRVKTSTTHPAMMDLVVACFGQHGALHRYPKEDRVTGYEWSVDCDVDATFEFLLKKDLDRIFSRRDLFLSFLAGFFDAEGSIYLHRKRAKGAFELTITNSNLGLLRAIGRKLERLGYTPHIRRFKQSSERGMGGPNDQIWVLHIWKHTEVQRFLSEVKLRNAEKTRKASLARRLHFRASPSEFIIMRSQWVELLAGVKAEVADFIISARKAYLANHSSPTDQLETNSSDEHPAEREIGT